jgi:ribosomal protein S18 acetylase RimI-like enzyme
MISVRTLAPDEAARFVYGLAELLIDVVEGGASVSFMSPLARSQAEAFWQRVAHDVEQGDRVLLAAFDGEALVGTAQLLLATPPNQPHRAEVAKVLVLPRARRRGVGRMLMSALEEEARSRQRTLLTLDTVTDAAGERLYSSMGYVKVGEIPDYALLPKGGLVATSVFYKQLDSQA